MRTYELKKAPGLPLYESLYQQLRSDILSGALPQGKKLPSKRALAENLKVSKITVETAYNQLLAEGYIRSEEKIGYFVEAGAQASTVTPLPPSLPESEPEEVLDLTANGSAHFPFSVWSRLQRQVLLDYGPALLKPIPHLGCPELRMAIATHLADFRGMQVSPENILIGAGTDFLYNLLIQLLGQARIYAVEEPGYDKIRRIYAAGGVRCVSAQMDEAGVLPQPLGDAQVLHISPSHHFPTGTVTTMQRRRELLEWANTRDGYIIEDDYDSEFRFHAHPLPTLQTLDTQGRVIYMNTFSKSLAPSIRIGFLVLPEGLMAKFRQQLGFYGCTVPSFEQYALARFLSEGHFEKHITRMRKFYRSRARRVIDALQACPWAKKLTILETNAGLHFLVKVHTDLSDEALVAQWASAGIRVNALSHYYHDAAPEEKRHCLLINYSGLEESQLWRLDSLPEED